MKLFACGHSLLNASVQSRKPEDFKLSILHRVNLVVECLKGRVLHEINFFSLAATLLKNLMFQDFISSVQANATTPQESSLSFCLYKMSIYFQKNHINPTNLYLSRRNK